MEAKISEIAELYHGHNFKRDLLTWKIRNNVYQKGCRQFNSARTIFYQIPRSMTTSLLAKYTLSIVTKFVFRGQFVSNFLNTVVIQKIKKTNIKLKILIIMSRYTSVKL